MEDLQPQRNHGSKLTITFALPVTYKCDCEFCGRITRYVRHRCALPACMSPPSQTVVYDLFDFTVAVKPT